MRMRWLHEGSQFRRRRSDASRDWKNHGRKSKKKLEERVHDLRILNSPYFLIYLEVKMFYLPHVEQWGLVNGYR